MALDSRPRARLEAAVPEAEGEGGELAAETLRQLLLGRAVPAALYCCLGWLMLQRLVESVRSLGDHPGWLALAGGPVRLGVYLLFCSIPVVLILIRPVPRGRDGRAGARLAAVAGTTILLLGGAVVPPGPQLYAAPEWLAGASTLLLVGMEVVAVYALLCLRRSFSIIPEARRLVSSGPYRLVRHPLYSAEIGAALTVVAPAPRLWSLLLVPVFIALQLHRARLEERLLSRVLPDYSAYSGRTRRLVPWIL